MLCQDIPDSQYGRTDIEENGAIKSLVDDVGLKNLVIKGPGSLIYLGHFAIGR